MVSLAQTPVVGDLLIVLSVALLDGLLSVDNALVLAEMVRKLPTQKQRTWALRAGLFGAYFLRFSSLFLVGFIIANPWVKLLGAFYLIYLMCENLAVSADKQKHAAVQAGFWQTVIAVELADLSFSLDNVVAAVAFSPKFYIVCIGVGVSILAMRFVAGWFVTLIDRFPVLGKIAYVLVGFIGLSLLLEETTSVQIHGIWKVLALTGIITAGLIVERVAPLKRALSPVFYVIGRVMGLVAAVIDIIVMNPLKWVLALLWSPFGFVLGHAFRALGINIQFNDDDDDSDDDGDDGDDDDDGTDDGDDGDDSDDDDGGDDRPVKMPPVNNSDDRPDQQK
jgi:tellurite resistance protein TerC